MKLNRIIGFAPRKIRKLAIVNSYSLVADEKNLPPAPDYQLDPFAPCINLTSMRTLIAFHSNHDSLSKLDTVHYGTKSQIRASQAAQTFNWHLSPTALFHPFASHLPTTFTHSIPLRTKIDNVQHFSTITRTFIELTIILHNGHR